MKIIFVNRFFYPDLSATSQMLSDLAFFLFERGFEVEVICSRNNYRQQEKSLPGTDRIHGIDVHRVWSTHFGYRSLIGKLSDYVTFYINASWYLLRIAGKGDIIVAKTDPPLISVGACWAARLRGAHLVNWVQDLFPEVATSIGVRGMNGFVAKWLKSLRNCSLNMAEMNVVLGKLMQTRLQQEGVASGRIRVIHNWVDGDSIQPQTSEHNPLREELGLTGTFVVGYSGNFGRAHEIETVLSAADSLRNEADIRFLFIGGGTQMECLREETAKRGLQNIVFQDYLPRELVSQGLAAADVHLTILKPELEGLIVPSKIYGILAAGRSTLFIGDRDGEVARILREGDAGITVESGDGEGLAQQIKHMKANPAELTRMGTNARVIFDERYAAHIAFGKWEAIFMEIAPEGSGV